MPLQQHSRQSRQHGKTIAPCVSFYVLTLLSKSTDKDILYYVRIKIHRNPSVYFTSLSHFTCLFFSSHTVSYWKLWQWNVSTMSNWDIKVAMYWTHLLFIKLIHIPFKMFNLLLPRLVYLMSWWPLTVCLSWCRLIDSLLLLIRLPASLAPQLPCWIDDGLVPPTASPPFTMFDGYWSVTHWSSLLFLPLWWFIASRWEYHYWHHPIGPFLWEEREGRAHIWWLLQVLENIQWTP